MGKENKLLAEINTAQVHLAYCFVLLQACKDETTEYMQYCYDTLRECVNGVNKAAAIMEQLMEKKKGED